MKTKRNKEDLEAKTFKFEFAKLPSVEEIQKDYTKVPSSEDLQKKYKGVKK